MSLLERCNLTMRMQLWRTNAHSRKIAHHRSAIALHLAHYHWRRVHETPRVTPAMELGLTNHQPCLERGGAGRECVDERCAGSRSVAAQAASATQAARDSGRKGPNCLIRPVP